MTTKIVLLLCLVWSLTTILAMGEQKIQDTQERSRRKQDEFPAHQFENTWHSKNVTRKNDQTFPSGKACTCIDWLTKLVSVFGIFPSTIKQSGHQGRIPAQYESIWSTWTTCTTSAVNKCYDAVQTRSKKCGMLRYKSGEHEVVEECRMTEERNCLDKQTCDGRWVSGRYSKCNTECGGGIKKRIHTCTRNDLKSSRCFGGLGNETLEQEVTCNNHHCPHWSDWYADTPRNSLNKAIAGISPNKKQIKIKWPQIIYRFCVYKHSQSQRCEGVTANRSYQWKLLNSSDNGSSIYDTSKEQLCKVFLATPTVTTTTKSYTEQTTTVTLTMALCGVCVATFVLALCTVTSRRRIRIMKSRIESNDRNATASTSGRSEEPSQHSTEVYIRFRGPLEKFYEMTSIRDRETWSRLTTVDVSTVPYSNSCNSEEEGAC